MPAALRVALAVALSTALYAAALYLPPAAALCALLVPLPGLVLATRAPAMACGLWFVLTASAVTVGLGSSAAPGFLLLFGVPALVLAAAVRRSWSFERTALAGIAAWCVGAAALAVLAYGDAAAVAAAARQQLAHSVDVVLSAYGAFGASTETLTMLRAQRAAVVDGVLEILPALGVLAGALMVLANLMLLRRWAAVAHNANLRLWRTPDALIWALIASGFVMFAPLAPLALLARNLFLVVLGCYFCQGLAIVSYYLERFRLPRGVRVAGYVLIAVQHIVMAMVVALGVFDLWGNFRRLNVGPADVSFRSDGE